MRDTKYIVVVKMPDGTQKEYVSFEEVQVGSTMKGGTVIACRSLSKVFDV